MACPETVNIHNLSGKFNMIKTKSDPTDKVLTLQQVGWIARQAIKYSSIEINVKQYDDKDGIKHLDIIQNSTGGMTSTDRRILDGQYIAVDDNVFGKVKSKTQYCKLADIENDFLKSGLDSKSIEADNGEVITAFTESTGLKGDQWTAHEVWSFAIVDGQRKYVRRFVVTRGEKSFEFMIAYDFVGCA